MYIIWMYVYYYLRYYHNRRCLLASKWRCDHRGWSMYTSSDNTQAHTSKYTRIIVTDTPRWLPTVIPEDEPWLLVIDRLAAVCRVAPPCTMTKHSSRGNILDISTALTHTILEYYSVQYTYGALRIARTIAFRTGWEVTNNWT